jgi:hypothetical protein
MQIDGAGMAMESELGTIPQLSNHSFTLAECTGRIQWRENYRPESPRQMGFTIASVNALVRRKLYV